MKTEQKRQQKAENRHFKQAIRLKKAKQLLRKEVDDANAREAGRLGLLAGRNNQE